MTEAGRTTPLPAPVDAGPRAIYATYMLVQAMAGVGLWLLISSSDFVRSGFELLDGRHAVTDAFFPADLVVIVASALSAWAIQQSKPWALPIMCFTAGGVIYPTTYLLGWVVLTHGPARPAFGIMVIVSMLTGWALFGVWRLEHLVLAPPVSPADKVWAPPPPPSPDDRD